MSDVLNSAAVDLRAKYILGKAPADPSLSLGLFVNDYTPTSETTPADLTECTAPGYVQIALPAGDWTGSTVAGVATYTCVPKTFAITGQGTPGQTVYGHFVVDTVSTKIMWAARWTTPWVIPNPITSNPTVTAKWIDEQCPDA